MLTRVRYKCNLVDIVCCLPFPCASLLGPAFESFVNAQSLQPPFAQLLASFCDRILRKAGGMLGQRVRGKMSLNLVVLSCLSFHSLALFRSVLSFLHSVYAEYTVSIASESAKLPCPSLPSELIRLCLYGCSVAPRRADGRRRD